LLEHKRLKNGGVFIFYRVKKPKPRPENL